MLCPKHVKWNLLKCGSTNSELCIMCKLKVKMFCCNPTLLWALEFAIELNLDGLEEEQEAGEI